MTEFTILWRDSYSPPDPNHLRTDEIPTGVQLYRGVRDTAASLWLIDSGVDEQIAQTIAEQHAITPDHIRKLSMIQEFGDVFRKGLPFANFVLREMHPDALDTFVQQLRGQIAQVIGRPGCFGQILAGEKETPSNLLGITYWETAQSFTEYMEWASKHAWKNTVDPVTLNVPLRLFTQLTLSAS